MGMTRRAAQEAMVGKLRENVQRAGVFTCTICERYMVKQEFSHVVIYEPRSEVMKRLVQPDTLATYMVCKECARLPEDEAFLRAEQYLVRNGLTRTDLKPLDAPGGHSPGHQKHKHGPNCSHGQGGQDLFRKN